MGAKFKVGDRVHVVWVDSCGAAGWKNPDNLPKCTACESLGWVVESCDVQLVIAGHKSESTHEWNGIMSIPKVAILSLKKLA